MWSSVRLLVAFNKFQKNNFRNTVNVYVRRIHTTETKSCNKLKLEECDVITLFGKNYIRDEYTNVTPHVLSLLSRNLHLLKNHPLNLIKQRIVRYMYGSYLNRRGNPVFSVYDKLAPVVTVQQNFDNLLIPEDHPSRKKSDSYYINSNYLLRPHTSAHQKELIMSGLDNFLVIGDVYRRDEIDAKHYPVFHQCEGVRLLSSYELFSNIPNGEDMKLFHDDVRRAEKQGCHTIEATNLMEKDLKDCLVGLMKRLFGESIEYRWTESYFPFTHPSWELEINYRGDWLEVLGCGIMEQEILNRAGAGEKIGWAFGLGLERLAMKLYSIPDIRLFWTHDTGFLSQFDVKDIDAPITYQHSDWSRLVTCLCTSPELIYRPLALHSRPDVAANFTDARSPHHGYLKHLQNAITTIPSDIDNQLLCRKTHQASMRHLCQE